MAFVVVVIVTRVLSTTPLLYILAVVYQLLERILHAAFLHHRFDHPPKYMSRSEPDEIMRNPAYIYQCFGRHIEKYAVHPFKAHKK